MEFPNMLSNDQRLDSSFSMINFPTFTVNELTLHDFINFIFSPLFPNIYPSSTRVVGFHHFMLSLVCNLLNNTRMGLTFSPFAKLKERVAWYRRPRRATWVSILDSEQVPNF